MSDHHAHPARSQRNASQLTVAGAIEIGPQQQILGRIAGKRELGREQQVGTGLARATNGIDDPVGVGGKVTNSEI